MGAEDTDGWAGLRFASPWRHYQALALEAFDADLAAGRTSTHIVAPPGSGKTVIGLEIARRLGQPALVLCPTAAIQQQWGEALALFGGTSADGAADADRAPASAVVGAGGGPGAAAAPPLHALTYQAICQTADPGGSLAQAALARLAVERARDTATSVTAAREELDAAEGAAARRREADVAKVVATLKREIARGEHLDVAAADLLGPHAAARLARLQEAGVRTVLLDECHHLVSTWGYLVRAVIAALGADVHVVGLTATSPLDLTGEETELYDDLLGEVDFEIPTPAVVKEGHLAPYQELALFTTPLASERAWLDEHHTRFQELLDRLHDPPPPGDAEAEEVSFPAWVIARIRYRDAERTDAAEGARLSFAAFAKRNPRLARAGVRYLRHARLELPPDAPRGEGSVEPPDVQDWLALLDDWALRCLRTHPGDVAERHWEQLAAGLSDLGFTLTRRGIRPGRDDLDRVLVHSAAKSVLVGDVLDAEHAIRRGALRAVVLCDGERPARQPEGSGLLLGGGLALLDALAADPRTASLRPLLMTGTSVACAPGDAEWWRAAVAAQLPAEVGALLRVELLPADASAGTAARALLLAEHRDWGTATYVPAVTRAFADGGGGSAGGDAAGDRRTAGGAVLAGTGDRHPGASGRVLIGTRALLGEGWNCPPVNVLVDCTSVAASISVRQMRGRSLRLDPGDATKIASNWDVVCVAPDLERGTADYGRFVRRHTHLHAPCEDGSIESGVSHVHPGLSPYAPPPAEHFTALNLAAIDRAADLAAAQEHWRVGEPYRGEELPVLLVGPRGGGSGAGGFGFAAEGATADRDGSAGGGTPADRDRRRAATRADAPAAPLSIAAALVPARKLPPTGAIPGWGGAAALVVAALAAAASAPAAAAALATLALVLLAAALWQAHMRSRAVEGPIALETVARAVVDAYVTLEEITPSAAASLEFAPRTGGRIRCALALGSPEENRRFATALEEALGAPTTHRYLVSRAVVTAASGTPSRLARALRGAERPRIEQHPVPADLGRNRGRADAYLAAWRQWVSAEAQLTYTVTDAAAQDLLVQAAGAEPAYTASHRTLWV